jgi:hypothetical protein
MIELQVILGFRATIRRESRVRSSLMMSERYICRIWMEHFTLSLSSKYADEPQQAHTGFGSETVAR